MRIYETALKINAVMSITVKNNLLIWLLAELHKSVVHAQYNACTSCVPRRLTHSLSSLSSVTYPHSLITRTFP